MISEQLIGQAAALLRQAQDNRAACGPIRELLGAAAGEAEAYAIQEANTRRAIGDGRRLVGRKIGLTSKSVQQQLGVSQPDSGMLFADMWLQAGQPASFDRLLQPKAEAEIALVLERDVTAAQPIVSDLLRAIGYVVPAIEIVDSRIADWNIRLVDTVADNASSGLFVLGGPARRIDGLELGECRMELWSTDGASGDFRKMSQGRGRDCLGNPLNAAVWLARKMSEIGRPLVAGDVIMTGALGPMAAVGRGTSVRASIEGIGNVEVSFE